MTTDEMIFELDGMAHHTDTGYFKELHHEKEDMLHASICWVLTIEKEICLLSLAHIPRLLLCFVS